MGSGSLETRFYVPRLLNLWRVSSSRKRRAGVDGLWLLNFSHAICPRFELKHKNNSIVVSLSFSLLLKRELQWEIPYAVHTICISESDRGVMLFKSKNDSFYPSTLDHFNYSSQWTNVLKIKLYFVVIMNSQGLNYESSCHHVLKSSYGVVNFSSL